MTIHHYRFVVEQLLLSDTMKYTCDMVLSDLYEKRDHAVGATLENQEMERLRSQLVIWTYPVFDAEMVRIQEEQRLPYTEAACVAVANHLSCPMITASHYSFDSIVEDEVCGVLFTR